MRSKDKKKKIFRNSLKRILIAVLVAAMICNGSLLISASDEANNTSASAAIKIENETKEDEKNSHISEQKGSDESEHEEKTSAADDDLTEEKKSQAKNPAKHANVAATETDASEITSPESTDAEHLQITGNAAENLPVIKKEEKDTEQQNLITSVEYNNGNENRNLPLTEEGENVTVPRNTTFNLNVTANWPQNSHDKKISFNYAYGLMYSPIWNGNDNDAWYKTLSRNEQWYTNLAENGFSTPYQNGSVTTYSGTRANNGKLELTYKDSVDSITIIDNNTNNKPTATTYAGYISNLGLDYIGSAESPALQITVSYSLDGKEYSKTEKLNTITFDTPLDHLLNHQVLPDAMNNDEQGRSQINSSVRKSAGIRYMSSLQSGSQHFDCAYAMMDDEYMCFEVPSCVSVTEDSASKDFTVQYFNEDSLRLPDGSTLNRSNSDNHFVLIDFTPGFHGTALSHSTWDGGRYFSWKFSEDAQNDVPYTVTFVKAGIKFTNRDDWINSEESQTLSETFILRQTQEEVFVDAPYADSNHTLSGTNNGDWVWITRDGTRGVGYKQEWTLGGINMGNRGMTDSVPKTVDIVYDPDNTKYAGITAQTMPDSGGFYNISNIRVNLINVVTAETKDYTEEKPVGIVQRKDFEQGNDWYIKEIKFDVDTIKARSTHQGVNPSSNDDVGRNCAFYGYPLKIPQEANQNKDFYASITIKDKDGQDNHPPITGRSNVKLSDTVGQPGIEVLGSDEMDVNSTDNSVSATIRAGYINYAYNAIWLHYIYLISPYGDEFSNFTLKAKDSTNTYKSKSVTAEEIQNNEIKQLNGYSNAKVYRINLDQITDQNERKTFCLLGSSKLTPKELAADHEIGNQYSAWDGVTVSYTTDINKLDRTGNVGSESNGLVYVAPYYPEAADQLARISYGDVSNGNGHSDSYHFAGLEDNHVRVYSGFTWLIKATDGLTVNSSMKMAAEEDTEYRTWNGKEDTFVGANGDLDYKINVANTTNQDVNGVTVYVPIPKKGDKGWNGTEQTDADFIKNDNGEFELNLELAGAGTIDNKTSGYNLQYAVVPSNQTSVNTSDWSKYNWMSADKISQMNLWSSVNFVKIQNDGVVAQQTEENFHFILHSRQSSETGDGGYTKEDVINQCKDIWAPFYQCVYSTASIHGMGEAVAGVLAEGRIAGTVWNDSNLDGKLDSKEEKISGQKIRLYAVNQDGTSHLSQTVMTDANGSYGFIGLLPGRKFYVETTAEGSRDFTKTENDMKFLRLIYSNNVKTARTEDMVILIPSDGTETQQQLRTATVKNDNADNAGFSSIDCGLVDPVTISAIKVWDDTNQNHPAVHMDLYSKTEGKDSWDFIDTKEIKENASSESDRTVKWENQPVRDAEGKWVSYEIREKEVNGYHTSITKQDDGVTFIVTNTPGLQLPNTGGIGTDRFVGTGAALAALCGVFILIRKRKKVQ